MSTRTYFIHKRITPRTPPEADFSLTVTGDELEPYVHRGATVYASRRLPPEQGCVGIFSVNDRLVCRQYIEDSEGNIRLFAPNRARRDLDITAPPTVDVVYVARLLLGEDPPLPG